jgi:hypothetical protein
MKAFLLQLSHWPETALSLFRQPLNINIELQGFMGASGHGRQVAQQGRVFDQ